jgi:hypothetical protein
LVRMIRKAGQLHVSLPLSSPPPAPARDKLPWPWGEGLLLRVRADLSTQKGRSGIMERTGPIDVSQRGGRSGLGGGSRAGAALWARVLTVCPNDR